VAERILDRVDAAPIIVEESEGEESLSPNLLIAGSRPPSIRTLIGPFQVRCTFGFFIEALQS